MFFENAKLIIAGYYNPFKLHENETNSSNFERLVKSLYNVAETSNGKELIITGDLNVDWTKDTAKRKSLIDWSESSGLIQVINSITRYRMVKTQEGNRAEASIIDHVYITYKTRKQVKIHQIPTPWSDHEVIKITYPNLIVNNEEKKKIKMREWRNYKKDEILEQWIKPNKRNTTNLTSLINDIKSYMEEKIPYRVVIFKPQYGQIPSTKVAKRTKKERQATEKIQKNR